MQIMAVLSDFHGGIGNLLYNSKDVSNLRSHLRKGVHLRDMEATLEYFQKQLYESPTFFCAVKIDSDNVVRGYFGWMEGQGRCTRLSGTVSFLTQPFVVIGTTCHLRP